MIQIVGDIQAHHVLPVQQIDRVSLLLAEHGQQDVSNTDLLMALRLNVEYRSLEHALKAQGGLHLGLLIRRQPGNRLIDMFFQFSRQLFQIGTAGFQNLDDLRRRQDRQQ